MHRPRLRSCLHVKFTANEKKETSAETGGEDGPPAKRARTTEGENEPASEQNGGISREDSEGEVIESKSVAVYVCVLPSKRGKFNSEKAIKLGLKPCVPVILHITLFSLNAGQWICCSMLLAVVIREHRSTTTSRPAVGPQHLAAAHASLSNIPIRSKKDGQLLHYAVVLP